MPGSCCSAVATALEGVGTPFPRLRLHGAVGLRVENDSTEHQKAESSDSAPCETQCENWWEPPKTSSDATRAVVAAACSTVTSTANSQFVGVGTESIQNDVRWGWCSQPCEGQSRAKERAARLRSAFRNAALAGGGANALMSRQARGIPQPAALSKSAEVVVGQAINLASGKVDSLQSINVVPCCESGATNSPSAVRVVIQHADAKSGGFGISFGRYHLPYRYPAACTIDTCALQITSVAAGSVASLRPDLRVGSVLVGVNGHRVSNMRLEEVLKQLHESEAAAGRELAGEIHEASLTLELVHEQSAPAMPPLSPEQQHDESISEQTVRGARPKPPRPPPPFANRVAGQLNDVLTEVIFEEQTAAAVRIQAVYRGGAQRIDQQISHLAATIMQAHVRGLRARKAVDAHRAELLAQEEHTRQAAVSAMPQLEEEHEEEEQDGSAHVSSVVENRELTTQSDEYSLAVDQKAMEACSDADVSNGLRAKLQELGNSPELKAELGMMDITPRTLARQLEVGGNTKRSAYRRGGVQRACWIHC